MEISPGTFLPRQVGTTAVYVLCGALALLLAPLQIASESTRPQGDSSIAGRRKTSPAISTSVRAIEERDPRGTAK
jgi:hypothetical protein